MSRIRWLLLATIATLLTVGGAFAIVRWSDSGAFVDSDQTSLSDDLRLSIEPGHPVGQTFVARHGGLSGIEFYLLLENSLPLSLTVHLRADPQAQIDLATASLVLPPGSKPGFYRFALPTLASSHGQYYYAFLVPRDPGVQVGGAEGAAYLDGAAYQAHKPVDAQTTFRLVYTPGLVLLDLAGAALGWLLLLILATLLFVVPGWALLTWLLPDRRPAWAEMLGLAVGLSLALYPTILLWTKEIGLNPGSALAWLPVALGLAMVAWRCRNRRPRHVWTAALSWARSDALWPDLTLLLVLMLIFAVRLLVVRTMETALWADSYQHTVMTQLILDHGGLFDSWEPYSPYQSLTVHFGFPTASAVLAWVTGKNSTETVLLTGQLMNGFAALTLYPLAVRLAKGNRWAGVGAVLAAGILSPMPAFYVNWGRFPQLTGQTILPVALWLMWETADRQRSHWRVAIMAGLAFSGMALAYYRTPFFYAVFVVAWLIGWGLPQWRTSAKSWLRGLSQLLSVSGVALLLLLPLVFRLAGGQLVTWLSDGITKTPPVNAVLQEYTFWSVIEDFVPIPMLISVVIGLVLSIVRRSWAVTAIGLWILALMALPAGQLIHLPGANYMPSFAILIALYIPVSLLVGWLVGISAAPLSRWGKHYLLPLILMAIALWATWGQAKILDPSRILVTRPDVQAMEWIQKNTPEDSFFLVEGTLYQGFSATGSDAGWWIPILAGRSNNMPPQYALVSEVPTEPGYSQAVVNLVVLLGVTSPSTTEGIESLCDWGFTHIYIGQRQGEVAEPRIRLFSEQDLQDNPAFSQVYKQDRVSIYTINPRVCRSVP